MITKSKMFGEHKVQYGVIIDHSAYEYLKIMVEMDAYIDNLCRVYLNGVEIGQVEYEGKKKYTAMNAFKSGTFKTLGEAIAAIISNFHKGVI